MADNIYLIYTGDDGIVEFDIKSKDRPLRRYTYRVPILFINRIRNLSRKASGKALNIAKKYGRLVSQES